MTLYFSGKTSGFYDTEISSDIPDDAIEISQDVHASMMKGQALGKVIAAGADGLPTLIDPPVHPDPAPPTLAEKLAAAGITLDELKEALK